MNRCPPLTRLAKLGALDGLLLCLSLNGKSPLRNSVLLTHCPAHSQAVSLQGNHVYDGCASTQASRNPLYHRRNK